MARRLPSEPPVIAGFTHLNVLGSGGFADVFLYEQNMPRRKVAVKVMLSEVVNDHVRQMFQAEANLMAELSSHPSILTVYQASVSSDGRPFIVMEYCSSALSERYRREHIPVPEVLRIAVKIGSAIETAHRAGVLHRDIKPSNILLTAYGHPVLSDFGIAATLGDLHDQDAIGMSIPWSSPEVLIEETPGSVESEVWSFAATVYSLLAGRTPFEVPGSSNASGDLMARIDKARVQPIGRPDVPASLERTLARAMSRRPENRPRAVFDLVREFQAVESELKVPQTAIEVAVDDWATTSVSDLEDRTRIRRVSGAVPGSSRRRRRPASRQQFAAAATAAGAPTPPPPGTGSSPTRPAGGTRWVLWTSVAVVIIIAIAVPTIIATMGPSDSDIPEVTGITAVETSSGVEFGWTDPGLLPSDSYQVRSDDQLPSLQFDTGFVAAASAGERVCITVSVNRDGRTGRPSREKCLRASP